MFTLPVNREGKIATLLLLLGLIFSPFSALQKTTTEVHVYNDIIPPSGKFPLPENAIELERKSSFLSFEIKAPQRIAVDPEGKIYVTDRKTLSVLIYSPSGGFSRQIGIIEKGRSKFRDPYSLLICGDRILIQDIERKRVESFNLEGDPIKSLKLANFSDIETNNNGELFLAHFIINKGKSLIEVYTPRGKRIKTFGEPLVFPHSLKTLNSRRLALCDTGELYIAFSYFPILRKYSQSGELLAEFKIKNEIMEAKEKFNLQRIGEGIANSARRLGYIKLISSIKAFEDKLYLLAYFPRLEILELDKKGNVLSTFWKDFDEIYQAEDLAIQRHDGQLWFYIIKTFPDVDIDIFTPKDGAN